MPDASPLWIPSVKISTRSVPDTTPLKEFVIQILS